MNTHPEQWAAIYAAAPGQQLGVQCLAQGYLRGLNEGYPDIGLQIINVTPPSQKKGMGRESMVHGMCIVSHLLCIHLVFCCNDIV